MRLGASPRDFTLFHSRRIGLSGGRPVPIVGGDEQVAPRREEFPDPGQVLDNIKASGLPDLSSEQMDSIKHIYEKHIWPIIAGEKW